MFDFSSCDLAVREARAQGLRILLIPDAHLQTRWCALSPLMALVRRVPVCTARAFQDFVFHVVSRYGSRRNGLGPGYGQGMVRFYEVGNQPDLHYGWRSIPHRYAWGLHLFAEAARQADPGARVAVREEAAATVERYVESSEGRPVWVTEVGYPSDPAHQARRRATYPYPPGEAGQAAYALDVMPAVLSAGAAKVFWYTLLDVPRDASRSCTYGLSYVPGAQCLGGTVGGTVRTKEAYWAVQSLVRG